MDMEKVVLVCEGTGVIVCCRCLFVPAANQFIINYQQRALLSM